MQVNMTVNGEQVTADVEPRMLLVHFLRDQLRLTGTHWGCDTSNCGTCVIDVDGVPVKSCTMLAVMASGHSVRTVEGLAVDASASVTIADIAMRAHGAGDLPDGIEGGLDAEVCYNPENLTYPYGAYFCVVDVDPGTAVVKVRRFLAVDDCGTRINPMIIEGQVHGGIVDGIGMALMEMIAFDEEGNCLGGSLMDT